MPPPTVDLLGMPLSRVDEAGMLDHLFDALAQGQGGWLVTANLDFLRRYVRDEHAHALYSRADVMVADGMPLVWAARVQGDPLPERVAGSSLIWSVAARAGVEGRTLFLLGGAPGAADACARELTRRSPALRVVGTSAPNVSSPPAPAEIDEVVRMLSALRPDIVLVGLGSPKQEQLIDVVRGCLPAAWWVGVGISFSFVAGLTPRAPLWMRKLGLEWIHRLSQEPRRLARRYLVDDLPFAFVLFARAIGTRARRSARR